MWILGVLCATALICLQMMATSTWQPQVKGGLWRVARARGMCFPLKVDGEYLCISEKQHLYEIMRQSGLVVSCVQGLSFLSLMPKYEISDICVLYGMLAEKDFGKICKAFLSCSWRNKGMGRFLCRIIFKTVHPKSNSFSSRNVKLFCGKYNSCQG